MKGGPGSNPKGRPRSGTSFAEAVRDMVDPRELIAIALDIARGKPAIRDLVYLRNQAVARAEGKPDPIIEGVEVQWPTQSERLAATTFLRDSGYSRPAQAVEISTPAKPLIDYSKLSDAELDQLEALHAKAAAVTVLEAAGQPILDVGGEPTE